LNALSAGCVFNSRKNLQTIDGAGGTDETNGKSLGIGGGSSGGVPSTGDEGTGTTGGTTSGGGTTGGVTSGGTTTGGGTGGTAAGGTTGGATVGCSTDQDCSDPNNQMCDQNSGQCVTRSAPPDPEGQPCTLSGANHTTNSCPNGYDCNGAAAPNWTGKCKRWVDGVDYCSGDQACVDKNGQGWTCDDGTTCLPPPPPPPPKCSDDKGYCSAAVHCCSGLKCDYSTNVCVSPQPICSRAPANYTDGRVAVPLIVEVFRDPDYKGDAATFVRKTDNMAMNNQISSVIIYKGPNYVNMDHVELFANEDLNNNSNPDLTLYPGRHNLSEYSFEDLISSLNIVRAAHLPTCADDIVQNDDYRWQGKIPLIAEIYQDGNYGGLFEQIITDTPSLGFWGLGSAGCVWGDDDNQCKSYSNNISSVEILKGPDYQDGDYVRLFHSLNDWWHPQDGDPHLDASPTDGKSGLYPYVGDGYNDWIANIYFYHQDGKTIGVGPAPNVNY
jgi:hypothetical protein